MRLALLLLVAAAACEDEGPPDGTEGGACYPNKTCNEGLTCASNLCVDAEGVDVLPPECAKTDDCSERPGDGGRPRLPTVSGDGGTAGRSSTKDGGNSSGEGGGGSDPAGSGAAGTGGNGSGEAGAGGDGPDCTDIACLPEPCGGATCDRPPPSVCVDAMTLRTFAFQGTCIEDVHLCSYPATETACPNGCVAGVCQAASQALHPWAGLYRGSYMGGATGTLLSVIAPDGSNTVYATLSASTVPNIYTGRVEANGSLSVQGMLSGVVVVTFSGSMMGVGPNRMGSGEWGAAEAGVSGTWMIDEINPWAGEYTGSFSGAQSGTLHVTVSDDGVVAVDAGGLLFSGSVRIDGTLDVTGMLSGGLVVGYSGRMSGVAPERSGSGTWAATGLSGEWTIAED